MGWAALQQHPEQHLPLGPAAPHPRALLQGLPAIIAPAPLGRVQSSPAGEHLSSPHPPTCSHARPLYTPRTSRVRPKRPPALTRTHHLDAAADLERVQRHGRVHQLARQGRGRSHTGRHPGVTLTRRRRRQRAWRSGCCCCCCACRGGCGCGGQGRRRRHVQGGQLCGAGDGRLAAQVRDDAAQPHQAVDRLQVGLVGGL